MQTVGMEHRFAEVALDFERLNDWRADGNRCQFKAHDWKSGVWEHEIRMFAPESQVVAGDTIYLEVTGDDAGFVDDAYGQALANILRLPVAMLFGVPNQPLFGNMREDDLIAHTFEKFIDSGDPEWPLLVPMVRSVSCAIDVISDWSSARYSKFVVGGASKRAWTSWLIAQVDDPRIVGIVPVVYDNLHMQLQIMNQERVWGNMSPMLEDYTRRRLHDLSRVPEGQALIKLVDPWTGLRVQRAPALIVNGSNDPFWTVDAARVYSAALPQGSAMQIVPNMAHAIGEWEYRLPTVAAFCARCSGIGVFPTAQFQMLDEERGLRIRGSSNMPPSKMRVWGGVSASRVFTESEFFVDLLEEPEVFIPRRGGHNQAVWMEFEFESELGPVRLTSPAGIIPELG
jgi:PhoPQ-activated pathogenicity-related protein